MSWSPKIQESRVDRPDEDGAGVARQGDVTNDQTASSPTRNSFDNGKASGLVASKFKGTIDTTQTSGDSVPYRITGKG